MKRNPWYIAFFIVLALHLLSILMHWLLISMVTKTLLMLVLGRFFIGAVSDISAFRTLILMALLFSWAGDVLLMFQQSDSIYFLLGLSSFLIAHLFYIFFFHRVKKQENIKANCGLCCWLPFITAF